MKATLTVLIIGTFIAILALAVYFRLRVLHYYRRLRSSPVAFDAKRILDKNYLQTDVIPNYPQYGNDLLGFSNHLRFSLTCASALIVLITLFAAVFMFIK